MYDVDNVEIAGVQASFWLPGCLPNTEVAKVCKSEHQPLNSQSLKVRAGDSARSLLMLSPGLADAASGLEDVMQPCLPGCTSLQQVAAERSADAPTASNHHGHIVCPICFQSASPLEDAFLSPCYHAFCRKVRAVTVLRCP